MSINITSIIIAVAIIAGTGLIVGVILGIVGKIFEVKVDEKEEAIRALLPGNNCGGCGFAGCDALAAAIAKGEAPASACPVGGAPVAAKISEITGGAADVTRYVAFVKCQGTNDVAAKRYIYTGNKSCREAATLNAGGFKACEYGCLGLGSCVDACRFDALRIINGVAFVDKEDCKGCSACVKACPKHLIELVPYDAALRVRCNSKSKGKDVKSVCTAGCIGCGLCAKLCPDGAVSMSENLPRVDYGLLKDCGTCKEKCPSKCLV